MSSEMESLIGKMLRECKQIRRGEEMSNDTFADILHGFAYEVFLQLQREAAE